MGDYLLGLDIGTTSIKSALFDPHLGKVVRTATRLTPVQHPQPGWSEHDPQSLWAATADCIRQAAGGQPVRAMAISSLAEAGVLVGDDGNALAPIIAWYDRRSEPQAAWIEQEVSMAWLYAITGQRVSPSFGATKLLWTREHFPDLFPQAAHWLPVPAYLLQRLTGQPAVDYTIAARTLLFDQNTLSWSGELLERFGLATSLLPPVFSGGTPVGPITTRAAEETGLPGSTICVLGGHDHLCAALAAGLHQAGAVVDSTGSANALLLLTPSFLPDAALAERGYASYAYLIDGLYTLKGGLKAAGSAVEWLARTFAAPGAEPDYPGLEAAAQAGVARRAGPIWLPHLIGSGTPQADRFSRAALAGMQFEHTQADLFRGLLESLAFWTRQNLEEMHKLTGLETGALTLTGGATRLKLLSQLKADVIQRPVLVPQLTEGAATGAALLAGLGAGVFQNIAEALGVLRSPVERFDPVQEHADWYDRMYQNIYLPLYETLQPLSHALHQMQASRPG